MLIIRKLLWDTWNVQHIARHHITLDEVEAICHKDPLILQGQKKGRLVLIGQTEEKRLLGVVLETKGQGSYYPITAYDADAHDTVLYNRLKGGEDNETNEKK